MRRWASERWSSSSRSSRSRFSFSLSWPSTLLLKTRQASARSIAQIRALQRIKVQIFAALRLAGDHPAVLEHDDFARELPGFRGIVSHVHDRHAQLVANPFEIGKN